MISDIDQKIADFAAELFQEAEDEEDITNTVHGFVAAIAAHIEVVSLTPETVAANFAIVHGMLLEMEFDCHMRFKDRKLN